MNSSGEIITPPKETEGAFQANELILVGRLSGTWN